MKKGIYYDADGHVVKACKETEQTYDGLTFLKCNTDGIEIDIYKGTHSHRVKDGVIVDNPAYLEAIQKKKDSDAEIETKLQTIAGKNHGQLDTYLDNNQVDNPAIRTLFHIQLALLHKFNIQ